MIEPISTQPLSNILPVEDMPEIQVRLTPRNGDPDTPITLTDNEDMVIDAVKKDEVELTSILLETGLEKDLIAIEEEVYIAQKEISIINFDITFFTTYLRLLNEYIDNLSSCNDIQDLREQFKNDLTLLIDMTSNDATQNDITELNTIRGLFRLFIVADIDRVQLKHEYFKHFQSQYLIFEKMKNSEMQEGLKSKILQLQNRLSDKSCELDEMRIIKRKIDDIYFEVNASQAQLYSRLIPTLKGTPKYCVNDSHIPRVLKYKVSPNHIDNESGNTLLHLALGRRNKNMIALLMERGADPLKRNRKNITAIEAATKIDDPVYLEIITNALKKSDFLADKLRLGYISEIRVFLEFLCEAKNILDNYGETLVYRKGLMTLIRMLLFLESRIDSRSKEFAVYYDKLKQSFDDLDPQVFFNAVEKLSGSADRGLRNKSGLHDALTALRVKFNRFFDAHAFNQKKEAIIIAKNSSSPIIKKDNREANDAIRENQSLRQEVASMKKSMAKMVSDMEILKEKSAKSKRDNSPRGREEDEKPEEQGNSQSRRQTFF